MFYNFTNFSQIHYKPLLLLIFTWTLIIANFPISLGNKKAIPMFHIKEGNKKCFQEHLLERHEYGIHYLLPDADLRQRAERKAKKRSSLKHEHPIEIGVEVLDPQENQLSLSSDKIDKPRGTVKFKTNSINGDHRLCFRTTTSHFYGNEKIELGFLIDDDPEKLNDDVATKEEVSAIEQALSDLFAQMSGIAAEQDEFKIQEEKFRTTSENNSIRVFILIVVQLITLMGCSMWQLYSLRSFFKAKKIA
eukprot:gb/GECH01013482.1/.p1 GENE.gb/GECH01013482.1/~~gb/GECH01013482.1/.p1  ORF type:complete len:248 (+),score=57.85 gb/GECH01013482.1/:1-744(+)